MTEVYLVINTFAIIHVNDFSDISQDQAESETTMHSAQPQISQSP
jgi:hypothetical protein